MTFRSTRLFAAALLAAAALTGFACQSKAKPTTVPESQPVAEAPKPTPTPPPAQPPVAEPFPQGNVEKTNVAEPSIDELNRSGALKTVYFAYNSNDLDDAAKATIQANAAWLKSHAKYTVEVGGHCDERGSIGYNVALGDRRATAVKSYLTGLGVDRSKLVSISYGEEKPADPGHNEAAWAKNRRAEFTIKP
jgi:peptidoglycan-associated lipoprotein